ncbi:MAG: PocR ligand-binding domain-containing protein [Chloroflexota bacterium]
MADLLTTKQLQDLLQIDRTTVYRMLKDGRLAGVKVGNQWRFSRDRVEAILNRHEPPPLLPAPTPPTEILPLGCVQGIQKVFAEITGVATVVTAPNGEPLTELSNSCRFCDLILSSEAGRQGCYASWRNLAEQSERRPVFVACHAGLWYARARLEVNNHLHGMLIAGQYYLEPPDSIEERDRLQRLATAYRLDVTTLTAAALELPVLDDIKQAHMGAWLKSVAQTFEQIGLERANLIGRLRHIAEVSRLDHSPQNSDKKGE